ncbi:hypothetical protein [Paenibacillus sp. p3-SID1389]|nr:hypothetical protein [Paenibacillus sp. p3-SID1389]
MEEIIWRQLEFGTAIYRYSEGARGTATASEGRAMYNKIIQGL